MDPRCASCVTVRGYPGAPGYSDSSCFCGVTLVIKTLTITSDDLSL